MAMLRWDGSAGLAHMTAPALVLGGSVDIVTKAEASETIADRLPRADLEIIEGVNHMGPIERADLYNAKIARFAERLA
jgi:pimeloyl-ACP methyl ester carboxylesterase